MNHHQSIGKTDALRLLGLQSYDHRVWDAMVRWGWICRNGRGWMRADVEAVHRMYGSGAALRNTVCERIAERAVTGAA